MCSEGQNSVFLVRPTALCKVHHQSAVSVSSSGTLLLENQGVSHKKNQRGLKAADHLRFPQHI